MKTFKTWEMLKALTENPGFKFENDDGYIAYSEYDVFKFKNKNYHTSGFNCNALLSEEWKQVQEPVDFMTAAKAHLEGKTIWCEWNGACFEYQKRSHCDDIDYDMVTKFGSVISSREIMFGKWFVEGG
jgi:hypothetical protein